MSPTRAALAALVLAAPTILFAPEAPAQPASAAQRPRIGLVLGGGGARGGAHLGVLEVLEELRVPFDCVAGTSMGALMAGAYVSGVSPAEMRHTIGKTDWDVLFDDGAGREYVDLRRKTLDDRFYSGSEFGVKDGGLHYREGAVAGEKIKLFFNQLVREDLGERNIEDLPLPLTLIATDIGTGERVAMREGNLTSAMRASMSVPGAIAPVVRDGRKLVDGGLVDNVPVGEVRNRCKADVVVAINVGSPLLKPEEVSGVVSVLGQMINILTEQNAQASIASLKPTDIYIRPELGDITAASFKRQLDAAAIGRQAALAQAERLKRLSIPAAEYKAWRSQLRMNPPPGPPRVDEVRVVDAGYVNTENLRAGIRQQEGESLDSYKLAEDLVRLYSRGDLTNIDYAVLRERDKTILRVTPIQKPWGPDYLRFGINLESDFRAEAPYNVRALYRKTWINKLGAEWLAGLQIGSDQIVFTEFYQPIDVRQVFFVRAALATGQEKVGVYFDGDRIAEYRMRRDEASATVGANLGIHGQASLGWLEKRLRTSLETGDPVLPPSGRHETGGLLAQVAVDTQDFAFFPTRGYKLGIDYYQAYRTASGDSKYGYAEGHLSGAWNWRDIILLGGLAGGQSTDGVLPFGDAFALGGLARLSAYAPGQIIGREAYGLATFQAQYVLNRPLPVVGLSVRAGLLYEAGYMKNPITEPSLTGRIESYGAYLATNSFLGPIYLGYARPKGGGDGRFYLFIGTP